MKFYNLLQTANTESLENYEKPHPKPLLPNTMANQVTNVPNPVTVTLTHLPHSTAMSSPPHQGQIMMTSLQPQPHPQQSLPTLAPRPPMQQTMQTNSPHSVRMATSPVTMAASPVGMATSPIRMIDEQVGYKVSKSLLFSHMFFYLSSLRFLFFLTIMSFNLFKKQLNFE